MLVKDSLCLSHLGNIYILSSNNHLLSRVSSYVDVLSQNRYFLKYRVFGISSYKELKDAALEKAAVDSNAVIITQIFDPFAKHPCFIFKSCVETDIMNQVFEVIQETERETSLAIRLGVTKFATYNPDKYLSWINSSFRMSGKAVLCVGNFPDVLSGYNFRYIFGQGERQSKLFQVDHNFSDVTLKKHLKQIEILKEAKENFPQYVKQMTEMNSRSATEKVNLVLNELSTTQKDKLIQLFLMTLNDDDLNKVLNIITADPKAIVENSTIKVYVRDSYLGEKNKKLTTLKYSLEGTTKGYYRMFLSAKEMDAREVVFKNHEDILIYLMLLIHRKQHPKDEEHLIFNEKNLKAYCQLAFAVYEEEERTAKIKYASFSKSEIDGKMYQSTLKNNIKACNDVLGVATPRMESDYPILIKKDHILDVDYYVPIKASNIDLGPIDLLNISVY